MIDDPWRNFTPSQRHTRSGRISSPRPNFMDVPRNVEVGHRFRFRRDYMTACKGEEVVVTQVGGLTSFEPAPGSPRQYLFSLHAHEVGALLERVG